MSKKYFQNNSFKNRLCTVCLAGSFIGFSMAVSGQPNSPAGQKDLAANDAKIEGIIAQMTLEEKVAMFYGNGMFTSPCIDRLGLPELKYADGPTGIREELEKNSWNPLKLTTDSATFFPTGSALAATWNPELAYQYGIAIGEEARTRGKDILLAPAINIQRIPNSGRTFEYLSEDPFLSSRLTVGYVNGVQEMGVAACVKHFALNNQETNRGMVNVVADARTMREIYLPPFEAAVKEANAYTIMSAYNKVNGYWCAENDWLLNQVLKKEWGFKGFVVSDWGGTHSTVASAKSGLEVEMGSGQRPFMAALVDSVKAGIVPVSVIDEMVKRILRVRLAIEPKTQTSDQVSTPAYGEPEEGHA
jgi:beta-glucosidase